MKSFPNCRADSERNRVSDAPQMRSMIWRASPAAARSKSISSRFSKALVTSRWVIDEKRTRSTGTSSFTSRISSYASLPINSPSRS